jgi:hypothetical protein
MDFGTAHSILLAAGVQIDAGLTHQEFARIEHKFEIQFPPDLRHFLSLGLPTSGNWVDWRGSDENVINERLDWPFDGMAFDIQNNAFWVEEWGGKPDDLEAALKIARQAYLQAPKLIPICNHRYIPATPHASGNPVFSIYQTDIIYYGSDLMDYLQNEFRYNFGRSEYTITGNPRKIPFWSVLAET